MGKPGKFDAATREQFIKALRTVGDINLAAEIVEVSPETVYYHIGSTTRGRKRRCSCTDHDNFWMDVNLAIEEGVLAARSASKRCLMDAAKTKFHASVALLDRTTEDGRWGKGPQSTTHIDGDLDVSHKEMSDDDLDALIEKRIAERDENQAGN